MRCGRVGHEARPSSLANDGSGPPAHNDRQKPTAKVVNAAKTANFSGDRMFVGVEVRHAE